MAQYVVELKHVTKKFPGVVAMRDMHIGIRPGEIHGLIGENGAGKSTLIKVLTGVYVPEEGEIYVEGERVSFSDPVQAREKGIACVYQELNIVPMLPVVDNVFMGRSIKNRRGFLDYPRMHRMAREALTTLGHPEIDTKKECGKLGIGQQQMVEIAKAVTLNAKLIIMDEPTSSLGEQEVKQLMATVRSLAKQGIAILFVSHKLEELFELCDRVTVMRDGEHILTEDMAGMTNDRLIQAMVGRTLDNQFPKVYAPKGECMLKVEHLSQIGVLKDVSFEAYGGQILAFAGLVGAGRTETMRAIFAAEKPDGGRIFVKGQEVKFNSPGQAIRSGIAFLTEDRKGQGLVLSQSVKTNLILANMKKYQRGPLLRGRYIDANSRDMIKTLRIKTPSVNEVTVQLSGGNQQKVVIARALSTQPKVVILDEPTRGIDAAARSDVYSIIRQLKDAGVAVLMVSSDIEEVVELADRAITVFQGRINGEFSREEITQDVLTSASFGIAQERTVHA